ncbi:MAG: ABC transporter ATP-binding protein [Verrucomicrobia bacterium]|nr:ABC transporter ATP-binding protein [Verrucomicrobiota bacterium]
MTDPIPKSIDANADLIPPQARDWLARTIGGSITPLVVIPIDLRPDGAFGDGWCVLTGDEVLVVTALDDGFDLTHRITLDGVIELKPQAMQGCGFIEVRSAQRSQTVGRFTWAAQPAVHAALDQANALLQQRSPAAATSSEDPRAGGRRSKFSSRTQSCETCNKPIPVRLGVCPDCLDKRRILGRLLIRLKPYWLHASAALLLILLITAVEMTQPILTMILIDKVIPNRDLKLFGWIIAGIVAIYAFSSLFSGLRSYLVAWLGQRLVFDLRKDVYEHLQDLSLEFYDRKSTGWIIDRVTSDTNNLQDFLSDGFQDVLRDVMTILVIIVIMSIMSPTLTLVTLVPAPLVVFLTIRFIRRIRRIYHAVWRRRARLTSLLSDVVPGARVVKAFAQESRESQRFDERSGDYMKSAVAAAQSFAAFYPTTQFVTSMGFVLIWGYGGYMVIVGTGITLGILIAFVSYLWRFYLPLTNLSRFSQRFQRAATSAQRVFEVIDAEPLVRDPDSGAEMRPIDGRIEFKNVTFSYEPGAPVMRDVSFTIQPGEMIGLVGPSGAGKSTVINLLARFYDVASGSIEIDGVNICEVTMQSLRRQIGMVLQDPHLFHGTIADNIAYGNPQATREDIMRAARTANAHGFVIRFPDGYDTLVGERGTRLSGGERQRIGIARAILKDPRILILDEATSSVDTETEMLIREAIDRLIAGRTTIAIAHRFSTLRNADRLIVLDKGKLVEEGSHATLMTRKDGLFRRLCEMQTNLNQMIEVGG